MALQGNVLASVSGVLHVSRRQLEGMLGEVDRAVANIDEGSTSIGLEESSKVVQARFVMEKPSHLRRPILL